MYEGEITAGLLHPPSVKDTSRGIYDERAHFSSLSFASSLFSSCPALLCSLEVLPLTDPLHVRGGKNNWKQNEAPCLQLTVSQLPVKKKRKKKEEILLTLSLICNVPLLFFEGGG